MSLAPCSYGHLVPKERRQLHWLREAKVPVAEIRALLGRHRSTVAQRERKRTAGLRHSEPRKADD